MITDQRIPASANTEQGYDVETTSCGTEHSPAHDPVTGFITLQTYALSLSARQYHWQVG